MFRTDDEQGFTIWNDARCGRYIAGMILDAAKVERCAGFMVDKDPVEKGGMKCYRIILANHIPKGLRAIRGKVL